MAEPMRVAITLEQCWHRVPGGTARAAVETTRALARHHPELDLVGVSAAHRKPAKPPFVPPIPTRSLPFPRRLLYDSWHGLRRPKVERATGPVDLIHATGLAMPPATVPIVWTLHDMAWRRDPSTFTARGVRFFERALALALTDAAVVLCSSTATMLDATEAGFGADRLRLVPLGAREPLPLSEAAIAEIRTRYGLDRPYVLHVGSAEPRKNLGALVAAMVELDRSDVDLVLVGSGGWGEDLDALVAPLGARARLLRHMPEPELGIVYRHAAAFAYPSWWEGFGLPVLEAMAEGAPVVTSAGTSCAEVAGDAALLIDPADSSALAAAIGHILDDPALGDSLRAAGRARVAQFTWAETARLTAAAYREAAG